MKRILTLFAILFAVGAHATPGNNGGGHGGCGVGQQTNGCGGGTTTPGTVNNGGTGGTANAGAISASRAEARATAAAIAAQQQAQRQAQRQQQRQAQSLNSQITANPTVTQGDITVTVNGASTSTPAAAPASTDATKEAVTEAAKVMAASAAPAEPKRPVSTAYAPPVTATSTCLGGASVGLQLDRVGLSAGGNNVVDFCETKEIADVAYRSGDIKTGDEIMCGLKKFREGRKRAGRPCVADQEANGRRAAAGPEDQLQQQATATVPALLP